MSLNAATFDPVSLQQLEFPRIVETLNDLLATPYGRQKTDNLLFSTEVAQVEKWLNEAGQMQGLLEGGYVMPLNGFVDILPSLQKIKPEDAFLETRELMDIRNHLEGLAELVLFIEKHQDSAPDLLKYARRIHRHRQIAQEIEGTIDRNGEIFDNASPELRRIRIHIRRLEGEQKKVFRRIREQNEEFMQDDIVTLRDGRMVLGIQPNAINKINGIVHGTSGSGATVFIEPMETLSISNEIQNLRIQERNEIVKILRFLTGLVRGVRDDLFFGIENLAILDWIFARARLAVKLDARVPRLSSQARVDIKNGRHPLLILKNGVEAVVPLSLSLGGKNTTMVITGPNAGGKTVSMKTVGLLILMTRIGCPIPAQADSVIPLLPNILVDIGDRQSLENDLSTFSAHIVRLREILANATPQTLVMMDEVGTGTDPKEGAALSIAILEDLTERGILTISTTHHGELKAYAHDREGVENASMEFDLETLEPTYKLRVGIPGSSYAFEIARRYGLPEKLLETAGRYVGVEKDRLEDLILETERRLQDYQKEAARLSIQRSEAEAMKNLYQERAEQLKANRQTLKAQAAREARQLLDNANAVIEKAVQEIKEKQADKESIKHAHSRVRQEKEQLRETVRKMDPPPAPKASAPLKKGDRVLVTTLNEVGELLEETAGKKRVRVLVGHVKMTLPVSALEKTRREMSAPKAVQRVMGEQADNLAKSVLPELDLRGLDTEQALEETNLYLHNAMESDWLEVRIVHGKGTGVLRKRVNEFLARDKRVLAKRLGKWGEGDTGVTVVTLRKEGATPEGVQGG